MSDDIRQIKDSQIFIRRFSDFHNFETTLGKVGNRDWDLNLRSRSNFLMMRLKPSKFGGVSPRRLKKWQYLLCLVNEDPSKNVQIVDKDCEDEKAIHRKFMRLDKILARNSGFLIGGKLRVRVEIRVLTISDEYSGLSMFNFHDPFENCVTIEMHDEQLYANKQVMMTHCERLRNRILDGQTQFSVLDLHLHCEDIDDVLQCIHGFLGFKCCDSYCEFYEDAMFMLSVEWGIPIHNWYMERMFNNDLILDDEVIYVNRRMKNELKTFDSVWTLKHHVWKWKLKKLNEEMMKAVTEKFFSFAIDSQIARVKRAKNLQKLRKIVGKWNTEKLELKMIVNAVEVFFSFCYDVEVKSWL